MPVRVCGRVHVHVPQNREFCIEERTAHGVGDI